MRTVTYRGRHADGSYRQLEAIITNLLADPVVAGMVINTRDVTERRDVLRTLAESEQRYKSLFEHNPYAVYSVDLAGYVRLCQPRVRDRLRLRRR